MYDRLELIDEINNNWTFAFFDSANMCLGTVTVYAPNYDTAESRAIEQFNSSKNYIKSEPGLKEYIVNYSLSTKECEDVIECSTKVYAYSLEDAIVEADNKVNNMIEYNFVVEENKND